MDAFRRLLALVYTYTRTRILACVDKHWDSFVYLYSRASTSRYRSLGRSLRIAFQCVKAIESLLMEGPIDPTSSIALFKYMLELQEVVNEKSPSKLDSLSLGVRYNVDGDIYANCLLFNCSLWQ